jgi:hypothetical protein
MLALVPFAVAGLGLLVTILVVVIIIALLIRLL